MATISDQERLALVVDLVSGRTRPIAVRPEFLDHSVEGRAPCRPFGITWSEREVFIANNRQLLVFDTLLRFIRIDDTPLQVNSHQIVYNASLVWVVSPWTNSIIVVDPGRPRTATELLLLERRYRRYILRRATESQDVFHYNSILWAPGGLFVAAHNFTRGSFIEQYCEKTLRHRASYFEAGTALHGLGMSRGEMFWINSGSNEIRSNNGFRFKIPRQGFARGFAMTKDYFVIGISEKRQRDERSRGSSWIQLIDRTRKCLFREFEFGDTGSINDLRLLDEFDFAHGRRPLWAGAIDRPRSFG